MSVSNQKKDGRVHTRPSFFWYDNDRDLKVYFLVTHVMSLSYERQTGVIILPQPLMWEVKIPICLIQNGSFFFANCSVILILICSIISKPVYQQWSHSTFPFSWSSQILREHVHHDRFLGSALFLLITAGEKKILVRMTWMKGKLPYTESKRGVLRKFDGQLTEFTCITSLLVVLNLECCRVSQNKLF